MATRSPSVEPKPHGAKAPKLPDFLKGPAKQVFPAESYQKTESIEVTR
jgi:hypothetical protein